MLFLKFILIFYFVMVVAIAQMSVTDSNVCTAHVCVDVSLNVKWDLLVKIEIVARYYAVAD